MDHSTFPEDPHPLLVTEPEGNAVRARLIEIENINLPGSRKNSAIHLELYDKIEIGRLKRNIHSELETDSKGKLSVDMGMFLCGRNTKNIKVFHSAEDQPTCQKCIDKANRLLRKGLDIYILKEETWKVLQEYYFKYEAQQIMTKMGIESREDIEELINESSLFEDFKEMFKGYKS